jgi:hypothetical protein
MTSNHFERSRLQGTLARWADARQPLVLISPQRLLEDGQDMGMVDQHGLIVRVIAASGGEFCDEAKGNVIGNFGTRKLSDFLKVDGRTGAALTNKANVNPCEISLQGVVGRHSGDLSHVGVERR